MTKTTPSGNDAGGGAEPVRTAENEADAAIRMLANDLHRLNQSVIRAVDAGLSVELIRSSRHHCGEGNWGDLLVPVITRKISDK